ncbi:MAG: hypothetical protein JNM12_04500 [Alphaproteobacteria bacterium]|nr:hypothetical protein [Alphaproteobacteria bacterium]
MRYHILKKPEAHFRYRGIHRLGPQYNDEDTDDSIFNQAWNRYVSYNEEAVVDKNEALRLIKTLDPKNLRYDLIGVERVASQVDGKVLGYDVASNNWHSILSWEKPIHWSKEQKALSNLGPIFSLIESYFSPLINDAGLFSNFSEACLFCDVISAVEQLVPGTWDAPGTYYPEVLAVFDIQNEKD